MSITETFLLAITTIFSAPYAVWRLGRTEHWAPLVVVQIVVGVLLGPGVLGKFSPDTYGVVFSAPVVALLGGVATWAVMSFMWIAGIELDLRRAGAHRGESVLTARSRSARRSRSAAWPCSRSSCWTGSASAGRPSSSARSRSSPGCTAR